jgi:hypothetical protein
MSKAGLYLGLATMELILFLWLPVAVIFGLLSLMSLLFYLIGETVYWLLTAHWMRITLCTFGTTMAAPKIPNVNQGLAHELDRCDVETGARGLDLILSYVVNDISAFLWVSAASVLSVVLFVLLAFLAEAADEAAYRITRKLKHQQ